MCAFNEIIGPTSILITRKQDDRIGWCNRLHEIFQFLRTHLHMIHILSKDHMKLWWHLVVGKCLSESKVGKYHLILDLNGVLEVIGEGPTRFWKVICDLGWENSSPIVQNNSLCTYGLQKWGKISLGTWKQWMRELVFISNL
jgi:hypothetical protein